MAPKHGNNQRRPSIRPSVAAQAKTHVHSPGGAPAPSATGAQALMTRRNFLYGAIGVGAVAAVGIGAAAYSASTGGNDTGVAYLDAPASALTTLNDFEALDSFEGSVQQVGEYDLPYGSLVWADDESIAACLLPTETGSPLAQVGLLFLGSGDYDTVLEKAVGTADGFEIYDVRANSSGLVWTEANILRGDWRVYSASISKGAMQTPALLEEGGGDYETPTLAVSDSHAIWQVNPRATEGAGSADNGEAPSARLMACAFGRQSPTTLLESQRRMSTPPYASGGTVTIAPRADSASTYYQLTCISTESGEVLDTLTLPRAITPIEAGYGRTGFMFSFPDIYDYDGAISNLGTYVPRKKPTDGDYNGAAWFDFTRTPTAAPAWCGDLLIVKSTYSVCGVDLDAGTYFAIDVDDGADSYGEYLASSGENDTFVTYTNIDHTPIGEEAIHACRVKVWTTA